jgi:hypothetical protein
MPFEAAKQYDLPAITLPLAPDKPVIKSTTIVYENRSYVAYTIQDSLELYKYLLQKDAYEEKLIFRINEMNNLLKKLKK